MSSCISSHGEYSEHEITTTLFTCDRCGVFDEAAAMAEIDRLNAIIQRVRELHEPFTSGLAEFCTECSSHGYVYCDAPCPTILALEGGEQ